MRELWTGNLVGEMHIYDIEKQELAEKLGVTPTYVSAILRGNRSPKGAKAKFESAVKELIAEKMKGE